MWKELAGKVGHRNQLNVASASTLQTFQHDLKTFLFRLSYPDIILYRPVVLAVMTIT